MAVTVDPLWDRSFRLSTGGNVSSYAYFVSGMTDIDDLTAAYAAGLPKIGDSLPNGMTVAAVTADQVVSTSSRYVVVHGRTNFGYAGYRHAVGRGISGNVTINLDNWTGTSGSGIWRPIITPIKRGVFYLLKTSYVSLSESAIATFFALNTGKSYVVDGQACILHSHRALASQSSALMVETMFRKEMPVRAYAAGAYNAAQSIAIPALDVNEDYLVRPPNDKVTGAAGDPAILVKTQAQLYDVGAAFPWTL